MLEHLQAADSVMHDGGEDDVALDGASTAVTVYRYGLLPPRDWGEDCDAEMRRMNTLWNKLVEIEHAISERWKKLTSDAISCGGKDLSWKTGKLAPLILKGNFRKWKTSRSSPVPGAKIARSSFRQTGL